MQRQISERPVPTFYYDDDIINPSRDEVRRIYEHSIRQRKYTISVLKKAIDKIRTVAKDTNIAKLVGTSTSLVGTGGLVAGLFLAPYTAGMSLLVCSIPSGALSFFGSCTAIGASIVNTLKESHFIELAKCVLQKDRKTMERHRETIENIMKGNENSKMIPQLKTSTGGYTVAVGACKGFMDYSKTTCLQCTNLAAASDVVQSAEISAKISDAAEMYTGGSTVLEVSSDVVSATGVQVATTGKTTLRASVGTDKVLAMSKSTLKFTLPLAVVSMSLDVYTIIQTSIDMKTGNTSLACGKLTQMCETLELELDIMKEELEQFTKSN